VPTFQEELETFRGKFWEYYRKLQAYQTDPSREAAARLRTEFDTLLAETPEYEALKERIEMTRKNKAELLVVLDHPELPLHNNDAELGARARVRKRDVSFGPRTEEGSKAWDTMQSLVATAKKLGISLYAYFADRVRGLGKVPRLADVIRERAKTRKLDASWNPAPTG
jgi:hypothetical protein